MALSKPLISLTFTKISGKKSSFFTYSKITFNSLSLGGALALICLVFNGYDEKTNLYRDIFISIADK